MRSITSTFRVAGYCFRVHINTLLLEQMANLKPFQVTDAVMPIFNLSEDDSVPEPLISPLFCTQQGPDFPEIAIWDMTEGYLFRLKSQPKRPVAAWLWSAKDFSLARLHLEGKEDIFGVNNALMLMFAFSTARKGILEMHSSVVMNKGKGFLFLGASGTGKSTHSRLWIKNIPGTELLNDDNPILRLMPDGTARVYGSPWSGKTCCYKANDVPVGAIVRLRQANCNTIRRCGKIEAYASLISSASAFRPFKELSDGWHQTIAAMAAIVPSYLLDCRPDDGAAQLCFTKVCQE